MDDLKIIVGVCREDDPEDMDTAYGAGTYARLFPSTETEDTIAAMVPSSRCGQITCTCDAYDYSGMPHAANCPMRVAP